MHYSHSNLFTLSPFKPNSAIRKVSRVSSSTYLEFIVYLPGIDQGIQEFSVVLGILDTDGLSLRNHSSSKYGGSRNSS